MKLVLKCGGLLGFKLSISKIIPDWPKKTVTYIMMYIVIQWCILLSSMFESVHLKHETVWS